jgi:hypothetical protein
VKYSLARAGNDVLRLRLDCGFHQVFGVPMQHFGDSSLYQNASTFADAGSLLPASTEA